MRPPFFPPRRFPRSFLVSGSCFGSPPLPKRPPNPVKPPRPLRTSSLWGHPRPAWGFPEKPSPGPPVGPRGPSLGSKKGFPPLKNHVSAPSSSGGEQWRAPFPPHSLPGPPHLGLDGLSPEAWRSLFPWGSRGKPPAFPPPQRGPPVGPRRQGCQLGQRPASRVPGPRGPGGAGRGPPSRGPRPRGPSSGAPINGFLIKKFK